MQNELQRRGEAALNGTTITTQDEKKHMIQKPRASSPNRRSSENPLGRRDTFDGPLMYTMEKKVLTRTVPLHSNGRYNYSCLLRRGFGIFLSDYIR
jgi:hypothetical protein